MNKAAIYAGDNRVWGVYAGTAGLAFAAEVEDPHFQVLPSITGTATETLTVDTDEGTITGTAPITEVFRWFRDGVEIEEAPEFTVNPALELA